MNNLCLLCSSTDSGNPINILNNENSLQRVNEVLNLSIKQSEENLPQNSCRSCWVKIGAYKDFQQKCRNTINHHKDNHRYRTNYAGALAASTHTRDNSIINMETNGLIISEVHSGYNIHEINDSESDSINTPLLLPMSPNNDTSHYNSVSKRYLEKRNSEIYICCYCNNKYKRFHFYKKHILKHEREEKRKNQSSKMQLKTFKCETCDAEFSKRKQLKVHMFEHKVHYLCSTCNQSFLLEDKYKWHIAQCEGKHRATTDDAQPFRRRTRSQSVASSGFASFAETDYQTSKWVADVQIYDDDDNDDCRSVRSDTTIGSTFSGVSQCSQLTTKSSISIRSTYSTKLTLTTEALLNTKNVLASMPQTRNTIKQMAIVAIDINMRGKNQRRSQTPFRKFPLVNSSRKLLNCFCGYRPKDLADIVVHDVKIHNSMLSYRCAECNTYFTKPEYLRMHEHRDHINTYKCYMCGTFVKSKSALKLHYEYHVEKTHNCQSCEMSFLKINQLIEHNNPHPETYKPQTIGRILESHTYIERPEKIQAISDGKHKIYERIQKTCPIKKRQNLFFQRLGGVVKTTTNIQDRSENQVVDVPDTFWEQRVTPNVFRNENKISEEMNGNETENSEIFVPDYDGEYNECSNSESENNNSVRLDDEISKNLEHNKSLEELHFFSTEDLYSNPRSSRSSSLEQELNGNLAESDGIIPMDDLEEDTIAPNKEETILNNSLSPSTSNKSDVLESNAKKYTINKRLKGKFLYKVRTKEVRIIKSPIPSYNELVHQSYKGFKLSSHKNNYINAPWRLANENLK